MSAPIEFYFDFASPYGYVASESIDALAERHGRSVVWHAIVLDANFQSQDRIRIPASAMRSDYVIRDTERLAAYMGVPYNAPSRHSLHTELAARIFHWLSDRNPTQAKAFAHAVYRAYYVDDQNIAEADVVADLAERAGLARDEFMAASNDPATKARFKAEIDMAEARGVFGSPFFIVEGERFWGNDRIPQLERWLASGPY
jgi:2-hydroxychromene-2-carboxylate isomerase